MHSQLITSGSMPNGDASLAWLHVAVFAAAVDANLDRWLADVYRIGLTEYRALGFLNQSPNRELRVNDLAQHVGQNPSSTTRLVSRLEAKGLAHRDVCMDDGRGVYAVIDKRGEDLLAEVRSPYESRLRDLLNSPTGHFPNLRADLITEALDKVRALVVP